MIYDELTERALIGVAAALHNSASLSEVVS